MVHISRNTQGLYLSERALKDLKLLDEEFPQPPLRASATKTPMKFYVLGCCCTDDGAASCMKRAPTPKHPTVIPYAPTKENRSKLESWLLGAFASSAFNTCTHQPLQGMTGVPMKAVRKKRGCNPPKAYTPIPVPFHWKAQVKADLD